jgi:hypothetical protein
MDIKPITRKRNGTSGVKGTTSVVDCKYDVGGNDSNINTMPILRLFWQGECRTNHGVQILLALDNQGSALRKICCELSA